MTAAKRLVSTTALSSSVPEETSQQRRAQRAPKSVPSETPQPRRARERREREHEQRRERERAEREHADRKERERSEQREKYKYPDKEMPNALDVLWGTRDIARYLQITERRASYLISLGLIPTRKLTHRISVASKREIAAKFAGVGVES